MRTVFVQFGTDSAKYAYNAEDDIAVGDSLKINTPKGKHLAVVTDELGAKYKFFNPINGEVSNTLTSTKQGLIKTLTPAPEHISIAFYTKENK